MKRLTEWNPGVGEYTIAPGTDIFELTRMVGELEDEEEKRYKEAAFLDRFEFYIPVVGWLVLITPLLIEVIRLLMFG